MKVRWGVDSGDYADGGFTPLWLRDSNKLEEHFKNNDIESEITIKNTHQNAHIKNRYVTENYNEFIPNKKLIRGTWFWRHSNKRLIPFHEEIAENIELWYQQVKVSICFIVTKQLQSN